MKGGKVTILGVGDMAASGDLRDHIKTFALGSCVAVILCEHYTKSIAMAHVALPDSSISPERGRKQPAYFADTGIPALIDEISKLHWKNSVFQISAKLVGGAQILKNYVASNAFDIGNRNLMTIRNLLAENNVSIKGEATGGNISRTVSIHVGSGIVEIRSPNQPVRML